MSKSTLRDHLTSVHKSEISQLSDAQLEKSGLLVCRHCDEYICTSDKELHSHINKKHISKRTATNHELLSKHLFEEVNGVQKNHWEEGLAFLKSHEFTEASFRQTLTSSINHRLEASVLRAYYQLLVCCVEANKVANETKLRSTVEFDPTPIWLLAFVFERLVLAPNPNKKQHPNDKNGESINQLIHRRLRLFRSGQIKELYDESNQVLNKTPSEQAANPVDVQKSAQLAHDLDNPKTAYARATKDTPVAVLDDDAITNLKKLYPSSYNLKLIYNFVQKKIHNTRSTTVVNNPQVALSPKIMYKILRRLKRGKASGPQLDSLDIFVKLGSAYSRAKKRKEKTDIKLETLSEFFTVILNGNVPDKIKNVLRTTYTVALHKDPTDKSKLRPLGVPSAIRRIVGIAAVFCFKSRFAEYLLPHNVAIGVNGGIDIATSTFRLGVEKYISGPEKEGHLPSRVLVSLDIVNMFNSISREKLLQIMARDFPELFPLAHMLYSEVGYTLLRRGDGTWETLAMEEGFSQGCPLSPIFAAIVLNNILRKVHRDLSNRAASRVRDGRSLDDGCGGMPIIMSYVDDTNALVPLEDAEEFVRLFNFYGNPFGANLNLTKTKILTSTSGKSIIPTLLSSPSHSESSAGQSLRRLVSEYTEEVNGLRVLGVPIGNKTYCTSFIMKIMRKAAESSEALQSALDDDQSLLQLFKICTANKMTHLFTSDVLNADDEDLPHNWNLWSSGMTEAFNSMIEDILSKLTTSNDLPTHATILSTISTANGGLGIKHPSSSAIPAFMLSTRRVIQACTEGVWISHCRPLVKLPLPIKLLFTEWKTSKVPMFSHFRRYLPEFASICVRDEKTTDPTTFFMSSASFNTCRERIKAVAASRAIADITRLWKDDHTSLGQLEDLLNPCVSQAMVDMSRLKPANRMKSEHFSIMLRRKLRLPLWPDIGSRFCFCGKDMDVYGDHVLSCTRHCKTAMSNGYRNGLAELLKRATMLAGLTSTPECVQKETPRVINKLPNLRPFDISILLDPSLDDTAWRVPLHQVGLDVVIIHSNASSSPSISRTARQNELKLRLWNGEKKKYQRRGKTDKQTMISLSGDDIIGEILDQNMGFIPFAVSPGGHIGGLGSALLYGNDPLPCPEFKRRDKTKCVNAEAAYKLACSTKMPHGILRRANDIWKRKNPNLSFSGSYKAMDPMSWCNQQLGLVTCNVVSSHLIRAHGKNRTKRPVRCLVDEECQCPDKIEHWELPPSESDLCCAECITHDDTLDCASGESPPEADT